MLKSPWQPTRPRITALKPHGQRQVPGKWRPILEKGNFAKQDIVQKHPFYGSWFFFKDIIWNPFCHFRRAGYKYPFQQACCRPWPLKPQAIMRLDTSGCHLSTKWMDFSVFQAPSPPSPFGAQESPGIHLDATWLIPFSHYWSPKNQIYEFQVGSFKCSFEEVLELTCDSQPKRGGGQTQGSLRNPLVVQCFETTDCNQLKDYLLWEAHIKSSFLIQYVQIFSNKSKTVGRKILTSTKSAWVWQLRKVSNPTRHPNPTTPFWSKVLYS